MTQTQQAETEGGLERIQSMFRSVEEEFEKFQGRVSARREEIEKQTQERVEKLGREIRQSTLVKRARKLQEDTSKRVEKNIDELLAALNIASRSEIKKLDRKLNQLNKRLKELDKQLEA